MPQRNSLPLIGNGAYSWERKYIEALGGVQMLIEVDTCHMVMVSEPERLASILVERCRLYA